MVGRWVGGGGYPGRVGVRSRDSYKYGVRFQTPITQLVLTGSMPSNPLVKTGLKKAALRWQAMRYRTDNSKALNSTCVDHRR